MPPPPAEPLTSRLFLGPALRAQPDRRLVKLVREGYEGAFEEIVRRYRHPLDRFAAAIVGNRSEDVTQDAFSKALLALRGSEQEIELRPWLYRIVRNTALNDLRDSPPTAEPLSEAVPGAESAAAGAERREEIRELIERLRALPEPQRAAIVMRELEGLSHEEIAAALGVSGGAARQAIYRARLALRDGLGLLIPLPLLRLLFDHGAEAATAGGAAAAAGAAAIGGGGATLGGLGAGGALKAGLATALVAGSVGAGVAVQQSRDGGERPDPGAAAVAQPDRATAGGSSSGSSGSSGPSGPSGDSGPGGSSGRSPSSGDGSSGPGERREERADIREERDDDRRDAREERNDERGDEREERRDAAEERGDSSGAGSATPATPPPPELEDDDGDEEDALELDDDSDNSGSGSADD